MDVSGLDSNGFVTLQYPSNLNGIVRHTMSAWKRFCELSVEEKQKVSGGNRIDDYGYMFRNDGGPRADKKELFHLLQKKAPQLLLQADTVVDRRAIEFIRAGDILIHAIKPVIRNFAESMERRYGLKGFVDEVMGSEHLWTFRFLHYFGGEMLANAHADRLGFTLHMYESHGGGEYLTLDTKTWTPWPVDQTQTIIFPSIGLQHRSECKVNALWHRVVPNDVTRHEGRYALVAFIDFPQAREWDKYTFTRLQDFPAGFNYGMPFEELDKFFVQVAA